MRPRVYNSVANKLPFDPQLRGLLVSMRTIARNGKRLFENALFWGRRNFTEKHLDPARDSTIVAWATYSPWLLDAEFQRIHATIKGYTLVDLFRCYELWHLLSQTADLEGDILEVGTWRGGTGCLLGHRAASLGLESRVFLCDTFEGVVKTSDADASYSGGEHADTSQPLVKGLADGMGLDNVTLLKGIFPEDTGNEVESRTFRFCHIDVDVYQSGKDVLHWVWPRMPVGGIVVFDDFGFSSTRGITQLVHEEEKRPDLVCFQNLNGHAVFVKTS